MAHQAVLLNEVSRALNLAPGEYFIDATVNRGGHSRELCQKLGASGHLAGLDADGEALRDAEVNLHACPCPVKLINRNFREIGAVIDELGWPRLDACLFDLGFSTEQIEGSRRGFSFERDEPLLMTFDHAPGPNQLTAATILNQWPAERLEQIFRDYGDERFSRSAAQAIVRSRQTRALASTAQLVALIEGAVPAWYRRQRRHSATKIFQALRIAVNDEFGALSAGLTQAWSRLAPGGRLAVITFHSGEARIVKRFFSSLIGAGEAAVLDRPVWKPGLVEIFANPAARSAQLRLIKKNVRN